MTMMEAKVFGGVDDRARMARIFKEKVKNKNTNNHNGKVFFLR